MKRLVVVLVFLIAAVLTEKRTYKGHKMYRMWPSTEYLVETLSILYDNSENFDFWTTMREPNQPVDLCVDEIAHPAFENLMFKLNVTYETHIEHVNKAFNRERKELQEAPEVEKGEIDFVQYHRYDVIMAYLEALAKKYPNVLTLDTAGTSTLGRKIPAIQISTSGYFKPAILIDAGMSGREWIGPAQALYIIHELVENPKNRKLIENVDWHVLPIVNPDAYEYTHTTDRLWRKTLSKGKEHTGTFLNRNFDVNWGTNLSSVEEDAWNYQGSEPFSEPESVALKTYIEDRSDEIKLYLSLHSFGPTILYPFGYTTDPPTNAEKLRALAEKVAEAVESIRGTSYRVRPSSGIVHLFSGSSVDWAVEKAGVHFAYTVELPSPGFLGFDFPRHRILEVVEETMAGIRVFHEFVENFDEDEGDGEEPKDEL